jgi:hypothetical protein
MIHFEVELVFQALATYENVAVAVPLHRQSIRGQFSSGDGLFRGPYPMPPKVVRLLYFYERIEF